MMYLKIIKLNIFFLLYSKFCYIHANKQIVQYYKQSFQAKILPCSFYIKEYSYA